MNKLILLLGAMLLSVSCASTTMINSTPTGADLLIDGQPVGQTPYAHTDTKTSFSTTMIQLKKKGYKDTQVMMSRGESFNVGACIGGVFLLVPFLWVMEYNPNHTYPLYPLESGETAEDHTGRVLFVQMPSDAAPSN